MAVEDNLCDNLALLGDKTTLRDACEYALMNGGKRFRPAIVMMVSEALGKKSDVKHVALGVEFLHTASLIADDLPCMDDDDERRDLPSTHKVYGEAIALLASYALIAAGYRAICYNTEALRGTVLDADANRICFAALENVTRNTGIIGATGGQFLDICPPGRDLDSVKDVIYKKTVTLFEVSFVLGWLFGGGNLDLLDTVKRAAYHFGMAFQIKDDIDDIRQDIENKKVLNYAVLLGEEAARMAFRDEIEALRSTMNELNIYSDDFRAIIDAI